MSLALSRINLGTDAQNDIRNAVYAGKVATAHEARINFNGWVGEGYTMIDPQTGAGAYMIAGGGNGAVLMVIGLAGILMLGIFALVSGGVGALLAFGLISGYLSIFFQGLAMVLAGLGKTDLASKVYSVGSL
ncbi:hypothetical protein [Cellvibrio sp. KY-GH-1]|uniref:hypothetical protein n=1 Tax=Cellvibrio sp. KY-GH-1 TaxID=2303332 RepID=UPI00177CA3EF|nr:hypothetical protein [Cellvibrio sp. KY-GH-1]